MELSVVTSDLTVDNEKLPFGLVSQHILGEDQGDGFKGMDLFLVRGLRKADTERTFTLRARPKRIAEFSHIPLRPKLITARN